MNRKQRRLTMLLLCGLGLGTAAALSATAFRDTLVFFYSPSDIAANGADRYIASGEVFRLGGMVAEGTVKHTGDTVAFIVTDFKQTLPVTYTGILPDLFREGQGVIAEGKLEAGGVFHAATVLAKHDERYMPPEVARALGRAGNQHHETDTLVGK